ncbi:hypothetical protein DL96DRAFT_1593328 [Flagelloscypha sp. PMI_526]|nr:hypothetical protein DL96DRAFT_1593328 [Flagelloscypha sp. PMI_526]
MTSFSIDDLVSSFSNGGHIGDEANDLQALQAQLAETLYNNSSSSHGRPVPSRQPSQQPSNTPTVCRTPSSSISYQSVPDFLQHHTVSVRSDILMQPSTPASTTQSSASITQHGRAPFPDPFYLDLLAQSQSRIAPPFQLGPSASVFAQAGMPCHSSPFVLAQSHTSFQLPNTASSFSSRRDAFSSQPQPLMASPFEG